MSERRRKIRTGTVFTLLILLLLTGIWLEINAGYRKISLEEMWEIFRGGGGKSVRYTLLNLRLPRVFTSLLVGVGLAVSGCVIQGVSPYWPLRVPWQLPQWITGLPLQNRAFPRADCC